jgi:DUF1009 family protein
MKKLVLFLKSNGSSPSFGKLSADFVASGSRPERRRGMKDDPHSREEGAGIGLIAGAGRLPAEAVRVLKRAGISVEVVAFDGITDGDIGPPTVRSRLGQLSQLVEQLRAFHSKHLLIVGKFSKDILFGGEAVFAPDEAALELLAQAQSKGGEEVGLMAVIGDWLVEQGFEICSQDEALAPMIAPFGWSAGRMPTDEERKDAIVGQRAAEALGRSALGQAVAVKSGQVVSREEVDGTDEMIRRCGEFSGTGATIVKRARPNQDRRFDLPAVGLGTINAMRGAGATALAVEAGSTLIIERPEMCAAAESAGLAVWSFDPEELTS